MLHLQNEQHSPRLDAFRQRVPGRVIFYPNSAAYMKYTKPSLSVTEQIEHLKRKGLVFEDEVRAERYLNTISYYRLSGYFLPFKQNGSFRAGTTFDQILQLYIFDRKLRLLTIEALEKIETAFKAVLINEMALVAGPHWHLDPKNFSSTSEHNSFIGILEKETNYKSPGRQNRACRHYYSKYTDPVHPPIWVVSDVLSFGAFSRLFQNINNSQVTKKIAKQFNLSSKYLASWIHSLTSTRNICAHHSRLWNKTFVITPIKIKRLSPLLNQRSKFFAQAVVIQDLLLSISNKPSWSKRLYDLLQECPLDIHANMGFPQDWEKGHLWQLNK